MIIKEFPFEACVFVIRHPAYWIGLSDSKIESAFRWETGKIPNWSNWGPTEPTGSVLQNCVAALRSGSFSWSDSNCDLEFAFLCQLPVIIGKFNWEYPELMEFV